MLLAQKLISQRDCRQQTHNFLKSVLNKDACEHPRLAVYERRRAELQAEVQRGTKPPPSPFCSVTQQHGGEEGSIGQEDGGSFCRPVPWLQKKQATKQSNPRRYPPPERADSAKHTTKFSLLRHATRFPSGQILPNIPLHSFFCVLTFSLVGRQSRYQY